ncbi:hypothetical protein GCM10020219_089310 [Nonomuraea dietziae]
MSEIREGGVRGRIHAEQRVIVKETEGGRTVTEPIEHWPGRMIGDVHVRSTPEGTAAEQAVFVHGLAGSATNWTDLMGELRDLVTGHAIDLPGAGYSPAPEDGDYSLSAHARAVIALMEHTGPRPPVR